MIIDEALDFLQDEKFGDFIAYLYRTFRKKEGSITLAAQNIQMCIRDSPCDAFCEEVLELICNHIGE